MPAKEIKFTCPECGEHGIEEIQVDVVLSTELGNLTEHEDGRIDVAYGDQTNEGGYVERYQCNDCGYTIVDGDSPHADDGLDNGALVAAIKELNARMGKSPEKGDMVSHSDLVQRFADGLNNTCGEELARLWNETCPDQVIYEGDSLYWVKS